MASEGIIRFDNQSGEDSSLPLKEDLIQSVSISECKTQNGDYSNCSGPYLLEKEEQETSSESSNSENPPSSCDIKLPPDSGGVTELFDSIKSEMKCENVSESNSTEINNDLLNCKPLHSLERVTSYENSSSESFSSDPSFGNTTDDQIDSVNDDKPNSLSHHDYQLALLQIKEKDRELSEFHESVLRLKDLLSVETKKSKRVDELEQRLVQYERELELSKKEQEIDKKTYDSLRKEFEHKYAMVKKDSETATKEKEGMVMRYAMSERELIDVRRERDDSARKVKILMKESESLGDKVKALVSEKSRLSQCLDTKNSDLSNANKEIDKLKEEINSRDIKIKWTQNKLKTEMETHKECPLEIEKLMGNIKALEEELSAARAENLNLKKEISEAEQNRVLESRLKEEQAKLIMERHEHSEIHSKYKSLQAKHHAIIEENNSLSFKVQRLETDRLEMEKKLSSSREETEKLSNLVSELQSKLVEMESLKSRLKESEDKASSLQSEMERVRRQNEELLQDMSSCRAKESEMLAFTQKLTTKNVQLQSEFSAVETKSSELERSREKWRAERKELRGKVGDLEGQLARERARREEETRLLARQVAEKKRRGELTETQLVDTKAALTQAKARHSTVVKELQRELSSLTRKLEKLEAHDSMKGSESLSSLTESNFSQTVELPAQNLVDRILKLQAENSKLSEKIEFLEEHSAHLVGEVQRKSRLLQSYILREEAGALAPAFRDSHKSVLLGWSKLKTSTEVTKHGGIMASLYAGSQQDDGMSLELCLEINRKLQAVLEDTLLKNIMLKENLDTLGDEISRLTEKK